MSGTHITWSIEGNGRCRKCGGKTVLVTAPELWQVDYEDDEASPEVSVCDEVSGHYCRQCERLVSLSLNTLD